MEIQEYNDALKEFNRLLEKAKKELADKVQPIFFSKFDKIFADYPEIKSVSWLVSTDVYDDENYSSEIEQVRVFLDYDYLGIPDLGHNDYSYEDCSVFRAPDRDVLEQSQGIFSDWYKRHYSQEYLARFQQNAIATIAAWMTLESKFGRERITIVENAIRTIGTFVSNIDYDFHANVFGEDVKVVVSRNGFTVEDK